MYIRVNGKIIRPQIVESYRDYPATAYDPKFPSSATDILECQKVPSPASQGIISTVLGDASAQNPLIWFGIPLIAIVAIISLHYDM
jgi:hypothetical protein